MNKTTYKEIRAKLHFEFNSIHLLQQILIDGLFLGGIIYLLQTEYEWLAFLPISLFMFRQFSILHEAVHHLSHPNSKVNFLVGVISGGFCLTPYLLWKASHMKHHYWTGNLEQDPTFTILKNHKHFSSIKKKVIDFCWKNHIPLLGLMQHLGFWVHFYKDFSQNLKSKEHWLSFLIPTTLWSVIFWQASLANGLSLLAGASLYMLISENMIVPQHVGLHTEGDKDMHLHPWEQVEITRTWRMLWPFEQFIALNMNYHTEHHLFPDLPWHQLKKAHKLISDQNLNMVDVEWMSDRRLLEFSDVIRPVAIKRKDEAA